MMQEVLLSSICDLKNGFAFKSKDYVDSSNTLSCRMSSIRPGGNFDLEHNQRFLPDTYAEVYSDYLLNDGDIVIAMTDLAGDPKILGVPTIVNTGGKKLLQNQRVGKLVITDSSKVFIPYLQYALNRPSNKSYYKKFAGGGLQINVSKKDILNNSVPLPPLDQQKKIAAILDAADAYRQKTKALIEKYDELTQSLFLDMFGDPVTNPMGWEKKILSDIATISSGITKGRKHKEENFIGDLPYMRVANVQDGFLELSEVKTIPAYNSDLDKFLLKQGDVLMTEGGDPDKLGRGAVWNGEVENCLHQNHIFKVRVNQQLLTPLYFSMLAGSPYGKRYFLKVAKQTTGIATINKTQLSKFPVLIASKKLQIDFTERVKVIKAQKAQAQASLSQAEDLFNSLLQRAFKGELTK